MRTQIGYIVFFFSFCLQSNAQFTLTHNGQVSGILNYGPQDNHQVFSGLRYIPKVDFSYKPDSIRTFDLETSFNLNGIVSYDTKNKGQNEINANPYRAWIRYSSAQLELRAGLQKIEFGASAILRPLQWFNQIDPRDPLQLTNGVWGILGRYYFLNNAKVWLWALYGNEKTRGFDILESLPDLPELGARVSLPIPSGESGISYHYRTVSTLGHAFLPRIDEIPEHRYGIDAKWDVGVGLWVEASHIYKERDLLQLTHQSFATIGLDYTLGIGNGVNFITEHMVINYARNLFESENALVISAMTLAYPLGFFDNISSVVYFNWETQNANFFINYQHQFNKFIGYVMAYYNPEQALSLQKNELVYSFPGPGIRVMAVYNY